MIHSFAPLQLQPVTSSRRSIPTLSYPSMMAYVAPIVAAPVPLPLPSHHHHHHPSPAIVSSSVYSSPRSSMSSSSRQYSDNLVTALLSPNGNVDPYARSPSPVLVPDSMQHQLDVAAYRASVTHAGLQHQLLAQQQAQHAALQHHQSAANVAAVQMTVAATSAAASVAAVSNFAVGAMATGEGHLLTKAREGLNKLQMEMEVERQRRLATERDLVDAKRDLSNERLSTSSSMHHLQLSSDKEHRLLRELSSCQLVESSLRTELAESEAAARKEGEERVRWNDRCIAQNDEMREMQEAIQGRDELLRSVRDASQNEMTKLQHQMSEMKKQLQTTEDELKAKSHALTTTTQVMKQIDSQLVQLDTVAAAKDTQRLSDESRFAAKLSRAKATVADQQRRHDELQREHDLHKRAAEELRIENAKLGELTRMTAMKMTMAAEKTQKDTETMVDEKLTAMNTKMTTMKAQQHSLARLLHDSAIQTSSLTTQLRSAVGDASYHSSKVDLLKIAEAQLVAEHAAQLGELQVQYERALHEQKHKHNVLWHSSQSSSVDELKRSFEGQMDRLVREIDGAIQVGVSGQDLYAATPAAAAASLAQSQYAAGLHGLTVSLTTAASGNAYDAQPMINASLVQFYSASLSLFSQQLSASISSNFLSLHRAATRLAHDHTSAAGLLRGEMVQAQNQSQAHAGAAAELAGKVQALHAATSSAAAEGKKLRARHDDDALLLDERANVIRELKRRYKNEQVSRESLSGQLSLVQADIANARIVHQAEMTTVQRHAEVELASALAANELIGMTRLQAAEKLRKRAEEEAEKYVRLCQQSDDRVFALQHDKQTQLAFFRAQMSDLIASTKSHVTLASIDAKLAQHVKHATNANIMASQAKMAASGGAERKI